MKIGIYKDTLANRRGADAAVLALAEGLRGTVGEQSWSDGGEQRREVVVFEKKDFEKRIKEPWDVMISTGTNELLDLYSHFKHNSTQSTCSTRLLFPFPVIQQFHTNPKSQFKWKRFVRNWKIRRALRHVSAIQVLSEEFVPQVAKYGVPVHVIGNWSRFGERGTGNGDPPPPGLRWTRQGTGNVIICPAAFAKGKNQKLLIEAFARVAGEFPDWRLRLLGRAEGAYAEECRRFAGRLCVSDRVDFSGYSDDIAREYARCAFVAFPSLDEGFPLTLADAAAFAKPCAMVRDWIGTAGAGGGIAAKPTTAAYAAGLHRLMADMGLCRRMGEAARGFCAERYSRERILDRWESLLNEVASLR